MTKRVTIEELLNAPIDDLPSKIVVDAYFDGTNFMHEFSREVMLPLLRTLLGPSPQEIAVRDTYYKMALLVPAILKLNSLEHFQSVAVVTRSLFEHWLDLIILAEDVNGDAVRKYNEFPEIEKFRVAEQLVVLANKNPGLIKMDISAQRAFYSDPSRAKKIATLVKQAANGKRRYPDHWTDRNLRQRAIDVGVEGMYVETYPSLSWYVHAGATGTAGLGRDGFEHVFGYCHSLIQRIFIDATSRCAKATKISGLDYFDSWMQSIKLKTGEIIVGEQIRFAGKEKTG
jgi:hypothetical protein